MSTQKIKFLFDLDGTITKEETLPIIGAAFDVKDELAMLTASTMEGKIPFIESFIRRVEILSNIEPEQISSVLAEIPLFEDIVNFIKMFPDSCAIVTGNCDIWVKGLLASFDCDKHTSTARHIDGKTKLSKIINKKEIVQEYQNQGFEVIFIGDGNNDADAIRAANIGIASYLVHTPAPSVMEVTDFVVCSEVALCRLLSQILNPNLEGLTIVLCCAGIGSRLGLGKTKVMLEVAGQTLLQRHLAAFSKVTDLRIVLGFQALSVINSAKSINDEIIFVMNHDYFTSKTGYSFSLGARFANQYVIQWDGDLIVRKDDISQLLVEEEYCAISEISSDEPVIVVLDDTQKFVEKFNPPNSAVAKELLEWTGPCCLRRNKLTDVPKASNVFDVVQNSLPLVAKRITAQDIDTIDDYNKACTAAVTWEG